MDRKLCDKRRNCLLQAISPFPTVFSKDLYCRHVKTRACLGKGNFFTTQSQLLTTFYMKPFENIVEKGENPGNQHFLLFPQCFLPYQRKKSSFQKQ